MSATGKLVSIGLTADNNHSVKDIPPEKEQRVTGITIVDTKDIKESLESVQHILSEPPYFISGRPLAGVALSQDDSEQYDVYTCCLNTLQPEDLFRITIAYFYAAKSDPTKEIRNQRLCLLVWDTDQQPAAFIITLEKPNYAVSKQLTETLNKMASSTKGLASPEALLNNTTLHPYFKNLYNDISIEFLGNHKKSPFSALQAAYAKAYNYKPKATGHIDFVSGGSNQTIFIERVVSLLKFGNKKSIQQTFEEEFDAYLKQCLEHASALHATLLAIRKYRISNYNAPHNLPDFKFMHGFLTARKADRKTPGALLKWVNESYAEEVAALHTNFERVLTQLKTQGMDAKNIAETTEAILSKLSFLNNNNNNNNNASSKARLNPEFIYDFLCGKEDPRKLRTLLEGPKGPIKEQEKIIREKFKNFMNVLSPTLQADKEIRKAILILIRFYFIKVEHNRNYGILGKDLASLKLILEKDKQAWVNCCKAKTELVSKQLNCFSLDFVCEFLSVPPASKLSWLLTKHYQDLKTLTEWKENLLSQIKTLELPWYKRGLKFAWSYTLPGMMGNLSLFLTNLLVKPTVKIMARLNIANKAATWAKTKLESLENFGAISELLTEENVDSMVQSLGWGVGYWLSGGISIAHLAQSVCVGSVGEGISTVLGKVWINEQQAEITYEFGMKPSLMTCHRMVSLLWTGFEIYYTWQIPLETSSWAALGYHYVNRAKPLACLTAGLTASTIVEVSSKAFIPWLRINPGEEHTEAAAPKVACFYLLNIVPFYIANYRTASYLDNILHAFYEIIMQEQRREALLKELPYLFQGEAPALVAIDKQQPVVTVEVPELLSYFEAWKKEGDAFRVEWTNQNQVRMEKVCQLKLDANPTSSEPHAVASQLQVNCSASKPVPPQIRFVEFTQRRVKS